MRELFETLQQRRRPEDVAEMIRERFADRWDAADLAVLDRAAKHSLKRSYAQATSMLEEFRRPVGPRRQVKKAMGMFRRAGAWTPAECADPARVEELARELCPLIGKTYGASDFLADRLNGERREALGLDLSRRRYNKLFRMLCRLEAKLATYTRELKKFDFTRIGKSRLATYLSWEEFSRDEASAAFIAYLTARCNLRSVFTNVGQERPYDEIADMLFRRLKGQPDRANWLAVAHVFPDPEVLARLEDADKGRLLGRWLGVLRDAAELLRGAWQAGGIDRATMIVRRGNDSTTWNNTANAWNRAREAWVALLHGLGMQDQLDSLCLGKVLPLIAADVARWYRASGKGLSPDTAVWAELPAPWEVLAGEASCTRQRVEDACYRHGVDPIGRGWVAPPPDRRVAAFKPTPELVHGVAVSDPGLAATLRRAGWFSGKGVDPGAPIDPAAVAVRRDEHGFALGAGPDPPDDRGPPSR